MSGTGSACIVREASAASASVRKRLGAQRALHRSCVSRISLLAVFGVFATAGTTLLLPPPALAQDIVIDGRTQTSIAVSGATSDVRTQTMSGNYGVNSFSSFNVGAGKTVNMHVPTGAAGTVNLVNGSRSQINGALNSIRNGSVGGELYLANPSGVVVGLNGSVNASTVGISTPTRRFVEEAIDANGVPSASHIDAIVNGTAPQDAGSIEVQGSVHGSNRVRLRAGGDIDISGSVMAGERSSLIGSAVNTGGSVEIRAGGTARFSGTAQVSAVAGEHGGTIEATGANVTVQAGASVNADGEASGDGGFILFKAADTARLERDAVISASAAGEGDGGFVEFSADRLVQLSGDILAASEAGRAGLVLVDPPELEIDTDHQYVNDWIFEASETITVLAGVTISSRTTAAGADQATAQSTGDSHDITFIAPNIIFGSGSAVYTHALGTDPVTGDPWKGGDITITAAREDSGVPGLNNFAPIGSTSITLDYTTILGRNVTLDAHTFKDSVILSTAQIQTYASALSSNPNLTALENWLAANATALIADTPLPTLASELENTIGYLSATAAIDIENSVIIGSGTVSIQADARTNMTVTPEDATISAAVGVTNTVATVEILYSYVGARNDVNIGAETTEVANLQAYSGPDATNGTGVIDNAAVAVSVRNSEASVVIYGELYSIYGLPSEIEPNALGAVESFNGDVNLTAASHKSIDVSAIAVSDSQAEVPAIAISSGDALTRVALGAGVYTSTGSLTIDASSEVEKLSVRALVSATGSASTANGPAIDPNDQDLIAGLAQSLIVAAGNELFPAETVTGAIALNVSNQDETTEALFGSDQVTTEWWGWESPIGEANFNQLPSDQWEFDTGQTAPDITRLTINAETTFADVSGITAVRLGDLDTDGAVAVALTFNNWGIDTVASVFEESTIGFGVNSKVTATTQLPVEHLVDLADFRNDAEDFLDDPFGLGLLPLSQIAPDMATLLDGEGYTFLSDVQVKSGSYAYVLDASHHNFDITTKAELQPGWFGESTADNWIKVNAAVLGELTAYRMPDPDWVDSQSGGTGAGAGVEVFEADVTTLAILGANFDQRYGEGRPTDAPLKYKSIEVTALNALVVGAGSASYGSAGNIGVEGAVTYMDYDGVTRALMDEALNVQVSETTLLAAADYSTVLAEARAGTEAGGALSVGIAITQANVSRQTQALFTGLELTGSYGDPVRLLVITAPTAPEYEEPVLYSAAFADLTVTAKQQGLTVVSAVSGAQSAEDAGLDASADLPDFATVEDDSGTADLGGEGDVDGASFGLASSTDYARLNETSVTEARIDALRTVNFGEVTVEASNNTVSLVATGAAVANAPTAGLGVAYASFATDRKTSASINGGSWVGNAGAAGANGPTITVTATDDVISRSLASGRGGSTRGGSGLGSIARLTGSATTTAKFDAGLLNAAGLTLDATRGGADILSAGAIARGSSGEDVGDETENKALAAFGLSFAWNDVAETTQAIVSGNGIPSVEVTPPEGASYTIKPALAADEIDIAATNETIDWAWADSDGAGANFGAAGAAILQETDHLTRASISGVGLDTQSVSIRATDDAAVAATVGAENDSAKAGAGGSVVVAEDERDTRATLSSVTIDGEFASPTDITIAALNSGSNINFQKAGGTSDAGIAGDISFGFLTTDWNTAATLSGGDFDDVGDITITARDAGVLSNRQGGLSEAGKGAGTFGFAKTLHSSDVTATIRDAEIFEALGAVALSATNDSVVRTKAVRSGEADGITAGAVFATTVSEGETVALIEDATVWADSVDVSATDNSWRESIAQANATTDATGIVGGLTLDRYARDTIARSLESDIVAGSLDVTAASDTRATSTVIGGANGGAKLGIAVLAGWVKDDRDVLAEVEGGGLSVEGDVTVSAERTDQTLMLQGVEASASAGVGLAGSIYLAGGSTAARIVDVASLWIGDDTTVEAEDLGAVYALTVGAGSAGSFSALGSFADLELGHISALRVAEAEDAEADASETLAGSARSELASYLIGLDPDAAVADTVRDQDVTAEIVTSVDVTFVGDVTISARDARTALAVTGQLQAGIVDEAGTALDKHFEVESLNASGFEVSFRPFAAGTDDADQEEVADTGAEASEGLAEAEDAGVADAGAGGNGLNVGGAIARVVGGGAVFARLETQDSETAIGGDLSVSAKGSSKLDAFAIGAQVGSGSTSVGASVALSRNAQYVLASVEGDGDVTAGTAEIDALANGRAMAISGMVSVSGGGMAIGGGFSQARLDTQTNARLLDTGLTVEGTGENSLAVTARDRAKSLALAAAGGGGSNAVFGAAAYATSSAVTTARILHAQAESAGDVLVSALQDQSVTSLAIQGGYGSSVAAGVAISHTKLDGVTEAKIGSAAQATADDDVVVSALSDSTISGAAMGAAVGGSVGISGSISQLVRSDTITAKIDRAGIVAGDSILVEALNSGSFANLAGADEDALGAVGSGSMNVSLAYGGAVGIGASVSLIETATVVDAAVTTGSELWASYGAGVKDGVISIARDDSDYSQRQTHTYKGIAVVADSQTGISTFSASAAGSGTVSVAAQVPLIFAEDTVTARVEGDGGALLSLTSGADIDVTAVAGTDISLQSFVGGGAGTVAGGADVEFLRFGTTADAHISDAYAGSAGYTRVTALTPENFTSVSLMGQGAGSAAIAGVVQVLRGQSSTSATLDAATIDADAGLVVTADNVRDMHQTSVSVSVGTYAGVGGSVFVIKQEDQVVAGIADSASAFGSTSVDSDGDVVITASATTTSDQEIVGIAAGGVGLGASVLVGDYRQTVEARVGDWADVDAGGDVTVAAIQNFTNDVLVGTAAAGGLGAGASIAVISMNNAVLAEIGANAVVGAGADVSVTANGDRSFSGTVAALGGGSLSFQAALLSLTYGSASETAESGDHMDAIVADMNDQSAYDGDGDMAGGDAVTSAAIARAMSERGALDLAALSSEGSAEDEIRAAVGANAEVTAGDDILVRARETGSVEATSGGLSVGAVSGAGGLAFVRRGTTLVADIASGASLTANDDVTIVASAAVDLSGSNPVKALAGSVGFGAGSGAVADVRTARNLLVNIGEAITITSTGAGDILLRATEDSRTEADSGAVSIAGFGAVGVSVATATHDSALEVAFAESGTRPTITGGDLTIEVDRSATVDAHALALSGGLAFSGSGAVATAKDDATATITLGRLHADLGSAAFSATVTNDATVTADAVGVSVGGGASIGVSSAYAERNAVSQIVSGAGSTSTRIDAGLISIVAIDAPGEASWADIEATAIAGSGAGLYGGVGALATAINNSQVTVDLRLQEFDTRGDARIAALSRSRTDADATGIGLAGLVALGAESATVETDTDTTVDLLFTDASADIDGEFLIESMAVEEMTSHVFSGQGSTLAAQAAFGKIDADGDSKIIVAGLAADQAAIDADSFVVHAGREAEFVNSGHSLQAALAGYGATKLTSTINLANTATVRDLTIETDDFSLLTTHDITKTSDRFDGQIGSVGAVSGTSLRSTTTVYADTDIDFMGARVVQNGSGGVLSVAAANAFDLADALKIDTGGGLAIPKAASDMDVFNTVAIDVADATLTADGDLAIEAITDADLDNEVYINVYGVAGVPTGDALTGFDDTIDITIGDGGEVASREGNVILAAGSDEYGAHEIDLSSEIRVWNATAIPITVKPDAIADLDQAHNITVADGGQVLAARDLLVETGKGEVDLYGYSASSDLYREGAEAVVNAFGSLVGADEVSFDTIRGTKSEDYTGAVTVDGKIASGAFASLVLRIGPDGSILQSDGNIPYVLADDVDLLASIEDTLAEIDDEDAAERLRQLLAGSAGYGLVDMIIVDDVVALSGDVYVNASNFSGDGEVSSGSNVVIEVINESPRVIEVRDLLIPFEQGGHIVYNSDFVETNAEINAINAAEAVVYVAGAPIQQSFESAAFTITSATSDGQAPFVDIQNLHIAEAGEPSGDIFVTGTIENYNGSVNLYTSDGGIYILGGAVNGDEVNITANGDFFLTSAEMVTSVPTGGLGPYNDFFDDYADWVDAGSNPADEPDYEVVSGGEITATRGVYIYADYLNVNGLIRGGRTDWDLTIGQGLPAYLDQQLGATTYSEPIVIYSPATNSGYLGDPYITGNVVVRYDTVEHQLVVDPMLTEGGTVELVGKILSTGGGRIEAANGFGQVDIDNQSGLDIVLSEISTGYADGVNGVIRIVDKNITDGAGNPLVTTYTSDGDAISKTIQFIEGLSITTTGASGADAVYEIGGDWLLDYQVDRYNVYDRTVTEVYRDGQFVVTSDVYALTAGEDGSFAYGENAVDAIVTPRATSEAWLAANPFMFVRSDNGYQLVSDLETLSDRVFVGLNSSNEQIFRTVTRGTYQKYTDIYSIAASYDIEIGFHGNDTSDVDITGVGGVILDGSIYNRNGQTKIESTYGDIVSTSNNVVLETGLTFLSAGGEIGSLASPAFARSNLVSGIGSAGNGSLIGGIGSTLLAGTAPLRLDISQDRAIQAYADGDIRLAQMTGDLTVRSLESETGDVTVSAPGSILVSAYTPVADGDPIVTANKLTLRASGGSIGTVDDPLRTKVDLITATAQGDINIWEPGGSIALGRVASSTGNVNIVAYGSITDGLTDTLVDRRQLDGTLTALWDELGLRESADPLGERADHTLLDLEIAARADYDFYWSLRGTSGEAYDPGFVYALSTEERVVLVADGLTTAEIDAFEAEQTTRYHALNATYGLAAYNAGFTPVISSGLLAAASEQLYWTDRQLGTGLRTDLVFEGGDTDARVEAANVIGANVTLIAQQYSIGSQSDNLIVHRGDVLDDAALALLQTAERTDVVFLDDDTAMVAQYEDVDISASGTVYAYAGADIFIGSEGSLALGSVQAGLLDPVDRGQARVRTAQGIIAGTALPGYANVNGTTIVLEGGIGDVGLPLDPLTIDVNAGGGVVARADGSVNLVAAGSLPVTEIYAGGAVNLVALAGSITDVTDDDRTDITAQTLTMLASGDIGAQANMLEVALSGEAKLNAASADGSIWIDAVEGDVAVQRVGAENGDVTLAVSDGDMIMSGVAGLAAVVAGGEARLTVKAGDIVSGDGYDTVDVSAGSVNLFVSGSVGTVLNPLVTHTAGIDWFGLGSTGNRIAYVLNTNSSPLTVGALQAYGSGARAFHLLNDGDVAIDGDTKFVASDITIRTLNAEDEIAIDGAPDRASGDLALTTEGEVDMEDGSRLSAAGHLQVTAGRVTGRDASVEGGDVTIAAMQWLQLAVVTGDAVSLAVTGALAMMDIDAVTADTLEASTLFGDLTFGTVEARIAEIDAGGTVRGDYDVSELLTIASTATIGAFDMETPEDPVIIRGGNADRVLYLAGEYGVNVLLEDGGLFGSLSAETALYGDSTLRYRDGTIYARLSDYGVADTLGGGIHVSAPGGTLHLADGQFASNGAGIFVEAQVLYVDADIATGGGDLTLANTGSNVLPGVTINGDVTTSGGDIDITANSYVQYGDLRSAGGDISIAVDGAVISSFLLYAEGDIRAGRGDIALSTVAGYIQQGGSGVIATTGTLTVDSGAWATLENLHVAALDASAALGNLTVLNHRGLSVTGLTALSGVAQLFAEGDVVLSGPVKAETDAVISAEGTIAGAGTILFDAPRIWLAALDGDIGGPTGPLSIETVGTVRQMTAFGAIDLAATKDLDVDVAQASGAISITTSGLTIDEVRSPEPLALAGLRTSPRVITTGSFKTIPEVTSLINASAYGLLSLDAANVETGGGSTDGDTGSAGTGGTGLFGGTGAGGSDGSGGTVPAGSTPSSGGTLVNGGSSGGGTGAGGSGGGGNGLNGVGGSSQLASGFTPRNTGGVSLNFNMPGFGTTGTGEDDEDEEETN